MNIEEDFKEALNNILNDIRENPSQWVHYSEGFKSLVADRLRNEVTGVELQYETSLDPGYRKELDSARLSYLGGHIKVNPSFCKQAFEEYREAKSKHLNDQWEEKDLHTKQEIIKIFGNKEY